nr:MAG TPA: Integrase [Caudoviricetes sp.]
MAILKFNIVYDRKHVTKNGKQGSVEIRFCLNRKQKYFSTGIKVFANEWDNQACKVIRHPDKNEFNQRLTAIRIKANKIVNKAYDDEDNFDFNLLTRMFKGEPAKKIDFPTYCEQRTVARRVSESTKTRYRVFTRFLHSWGKIISFSDLTVAKVRAMDEYLHTREIAPATIYNYHKYLKLFINDAVIDNLVQENPYRRLSFKIPRGDKQYVDCLTVEQFEEIRSITVSTPHLAKVRDLFLFQCYTGLAYSDLMAFDFNECDLVDGKYLYHDRRVKNSVDFVLQLLPQAVEILEKYNYKLPQISNQKYNDYLKVIGLMIGVNNLHSHMGRATAATMFLSKGMPINIVSKVLGHTNLRQTQRYARTLSRDVRAAFDALENKI